MVTSFGMRILTNTTLFSICAAFSKLSLVSPLAAFLTPPVRIASVFSVERDLSGPRKLSISTLVLCDTEGDGDGD